MRPDHLAAGAHGDAGPDLPEGMELRPLSAEEALQVPEVWNAAWREPNPYPLGAPLWQERLASPHHDPELLLGAIADGEVLAYAHGKRPVSAWQPANLAWVSSFAVRRSFQGRGIGTALVGELLRELSKASPAEVHFGSDADHLLPGPPLDSPPATWRLLRRMGAAFSVCELDLHLDLRAGLPAAPVPPGWRVREGDDEGALAFVRATFPGRWAEELAAYLRGGATVFTVERDDSAEEPTSARAKGFCVAFQGGEAVTSPGLHWAEALRREYPGGRAAGMGPLGTAPDVRGLGLGLAMVRAAAQTLEERGSTDVIINWTTLGTFYGRLGARVWRAYQRARAPGDRPPVSGGEG